MKVLSAPVSTIRTFSLPGEALGTDGSLQTPSSGPAAVCRL